VSKITKKQSEGVRFFVNSAFKIRCHVVKKYTPKDCFSAILPTESGFIEADKKNMFWKPTFDVILSV